MSGSPNRSVGFFRRAHAQKRAADLAVKAAESPSTSTANADAADGKAKKSAKAADGRSPNNP